MTKKTLSDQEDDIPILSKSGYSNPALSFPLAIYQCSFMNLIFMRKPHLLTIFSTVHIASIYSCDTNKALFPRRCIFFLIISPH